MDKMIDKLKIDYKEKPAESPGVWFPSKLKINIVGDRRQVKFIHEQVLKAITESQNK